MYTHIRVAHLSSDTIMRTMRYPAGLHTSTIGHVTQSFYVQAWLKCCYTLCTAAELKWSGNNDGNKLEVEIVRD